MGDISKSPTATPADSLHKLPISRMASVDFASGDAVALDGKGNFIPCTPDLEFAGLTPNPIPRGTIGAAYGAGVEFIYSEEILSKDADIYLSDGNVSDIPSKEGDEPIAKVLDGGNIILTRGFDITALSNLHMQGK